MNWYLEPLKKYATFNGRAIRREYWTFGLVNWLVSALLGVSVQVSAPALDVAAGDGPGPLYWILSAAYWIFTAAILIPSIAVSVRRLHDTDRSGWWLLIALIPVLGAIVLLIFTLQGSKPENQYGPNLHVLSPRPQSEEERMAVLRGGDGQASAPHVG